MRDLFNIILTTAAILSVAMLTAYLVVAIQRHRNRRYLKKLLERDDR